MTAQTKQNNQTVKRGLKICVKCGIIGKTKYQVEYLTCKNCQVTERRERQA